MQKRYAKTLFIGDQIVGSIGVLLFNRGRHRIHHFLPLLACIFFVYVLLSYLSLAIDEPQIIIRRYLSSINEANTRIPLGEENDFRVPRQSEGAPGRKLWATNMSELFYGCSNSSNQSLTAEVKTEDNRYLVIETSGGLNQQRTGIVDAVVAAYILNATLVIPKLDQKSYWKDASNFSEVFDVDWFILHLAKDVKIIKELPTINGKSIIPYTTFSPRKCDVQCYHTRILPLLKQKQAVRLKQFDYRLSNRLPTELQKLRCKVNYHGLQFTPSIIEMGLKLVERMRMKSKHFVALHLRFEPDMLAFSGCHYGGGEREREDLATIRRRWKSLHKKNPNSDRQRMKGKCPLTPEEVGLMLRALGYGDDVHIYVASGEVYRGEDTLAPLKAMFPNFYTKETIAFREELEPFTSYSSRMAALDYIVCDESDVFVTNNNGNMAKMLAGRRRYFGHKPTIRPNSKKLYKVFMEREKMSWGNFSSLIQIKQIGLMGDPNEVKLGKGVFHEHPLACICEKAGANNTIKELNSQITDNIGSHEVVEMEDDNTMRDDDHQDWQDL